jgi:hypothetical protein
MTRPPVATFVALLMPLTLVASAAAQPGGIQMPDPRQMSGVPLPVGDLQPGTVSVRLIRGSLDKPIPGQTVTISGGATPVTGTTNDAGRVQISGLPIGTRVKASAVIDGERLESQEFGIPPQGGVRLMLVATDPEAAARSADDEKPAGGPPQSGMVVLGDQTRFVFEMGDEGLNAFNIVQILNTARTPVQPAQPVVFEIPEEGVGASLLEGSSSQATVQGKRVIVSGPFAPGMTLVQFAYSLPFSGDRLTIHQTLPAQLQQLTVLAQKAGDNMHLASPQMAQHREMQTEGRTYIVGQGPALNAGGVLTFEFTGLPHGPTWPRNLALVLALTILGAGAWGAVRSGRADAGSSGRRQKLEARRDRLFNELVSLEEQHRAGDLDRERYDRKRRELVDALERVYAQIDEEAAA